MSVEVWRGSVEVWRSSLGVCLANECMAMPAMAPMPHLEHVLNLFSLSYSHVLVGEDALADDAQLLRHLRIFLIRPFLPLKHIQGGQTLRGPPD